MSTPEHPPGSPEAVAQGCTCSSALNHNGEGIPGPRGRYYQAELQCPMHGLEAAKEALEAGDAWLIPSPLDDEDDEEAEPTRH